MKLSEIINKIKYFLGKQSDVIYVFIITLLISVAVLVPLFTIVPQFSDSAYNTRIIERMVEKKSLLPYDSGIWTDFYINPPSVDSKSYHPPFFYSFIAILKYSLPFVSIEMILNTLAILSIPIMAVLIFKITEHLFNNRLTSYIASISIVSSSMIWWITGHRIAEGLLFPMLFFFSYSYIKDKKLTWWKSILLFLISFVKIAGAFFSAGFFFFTIYEYLIKKKKVFDKSFLIFWGIFAVLFVLIEGFYIFPNYKTLYPSPDKLPVIDELFLESYKVQELKEWDKNLSDLTQYYSKNYDVNLAGLPMTFDFIAQGDVTGPLQIFTPYRVLQNKHTAYYHWFGPNLIGMAVVIIIGMILGIESLRKNKALRFYTLFVLFSSIFCLIMYVKLGIYQYFYFINLLFLPLMIDGLIKLFEKIIPGKFGKVILILILTIYAIVIIFTSYSDIANYRYSLNHIPFTKSSLSNYVAFDDLKAVGELDELKNETRIFAPMRELAYWTKKDVIFDSRIIFLDPKYRNDMFKNYNTSIVVLPNFGGDQYWFLDKLNYTVIKEFKTITVYKISTN